MILYMKRKKMTPFFQQKLNELEEVCHHFDKTTSRVGNSTELNFRKDLPVFFFAFNNTTLVGYLSLFLPGSQEAEINAIVHPYYRQKRIFLHLLSMAANVLAATTVSHVIFVCEPKSKDAVAAMLKMKSRLLYSEYLMTLAKKSIYELPSEPSLTLSKATGEDAEAIALLQSKIFLTDIDSATRMTTTALETPTFTQYKLMQKDVLIGICSISHYSKHCLIFGLGVDPAFHGKGYGNFLLQSVLQRLPPGKPIILQVSSLNTIAFSLYEKTGFQITTQQDYWLLTRLI